MIEIVKDKAGNVVERKRNGKTLFRLRCVTRARKGAPRGHKVLKDGYTREFVAE